ncbi:unnamed protein product [Ectocarpus sp. CCAP 1310/34]|nr:unnamed protein product [Ectocarpus sp. CCAP 1310/34]
MLDGEISKYVDILQGVAQGCSMSPTLFKIYINDMIRAVEAEQIDAAVGYTRKWRLSANVGKCAVVVCNEDKKNPVEFKWKWGEEELPVVDRYSYLGVEISKECSWDAHMAKLIGKGKAQIGKTDEILTDPHLDTRIKRCVLLNVIVPKLEYAGELRVAHTVINNLRNANNRCLVCDDKIEGFLPAVPIVCQKGFKEKISVACAEREEQNLWKEPKDKEGLEVYGMLTEEIGFKDYLRGPMDAGTKLKVKFRTGDMGLGERQRRHRTVDDEHDEFKCDCGFECEDRVHVVAECPLYKKEREVYVTELGKIDGTNREIFEAWNREERTVDVLGHGRWVEQAGRGTVRKGRLGKTFLSHLWQSRKERLAIGDRCCGNNAPSSRGRVVNGLTAKACKTEEYVPPTIFPTGVTF